MHKSKSITASYIVFSYYNSLSNKLSRDYTNILFPTSRVSPVRITEDHMADGNIIGVMTNFFDTEQIIFDTCEISLENNFSLLTPYMSICISMCRRTFFTLLGCFANPLIFLFMFTLCYFFANLLHDTCMTLAKTINYDRARN